MIDRLHRNPLGVLHGVVLDFRQDCLILVLSRLPTHRSTVISLYSPSLNACGPVMSNGERVTLSK